LRLLWVYKYRLVSRMKLGDWLAVSAVFYLTFYIGLCINEVFNPPALELLKEPEPTAVSKALAEEYKDL